MVLGCQRSGTTLLGMALEAHSSIEIIEENNSVFHRQGEITKELNLDAIIEYERTQSCLVGYKAPRESYRSLRLLEDLPGTLYIWIRRDLLQVVASMLSLRLRGASWADTFAQREIAKYIKVTPDDQKIISIFKRALARKSQRKRALELGTLCWLVKRRSEDLLFSKAPESSHLINYNDLVGDSEISLRNILSFLGVEWESNVINHPKFISGHRPGMSSADSPINNKSIDKWRNVLAATDVEIINRVVEEFGPDLNM